MISSFHTYVLTLGQHISELDPFCINLIQFFKQFVKTVIYIKHKEDYRSVQIEIDSNFVLKNPYSGLYPHSEKSVLESVMSNTESYILYKRGSFKVISLAVTFQVLNNSVYQNCNICDVKPVQRFASL